MTAQQIIQNLHMHPIPEGGMCAEHIVSENWVETPRGSRRAYSTIYYLLEGHDRSAFHQLRGDEVWGYHAGAPFTLYMIKDGILHSEVLGPDAAAGQQPQILVPAGTIFGATVEGEWGLCGCFCAPGFADEDLYFPTKDELSPYIADTDFLERMVLCAK